MRDHFLHGFALGLGVGLGYILGYQVVDLANRLWSLWQS